MPYPYDPYDEEDDDPINRIFRRREDEMTARAPSVAETPIGRSSVPSYPGEAPSLPDAYGSLPSRPNPSAMESYRGHIEGYPEEKAYRTKGARNIFGRILGGVLPASPLAQEASAELTHPGFSRARRDWAEKEKKLGALSKLEGEQIAERRKTSESEARIESERAQTESARATTELRRKQMGMPSRLEASPTTYEAHLVRQLRNPNISDEDKQIIEAYLQEMKDKPEARDTHEAEYSALRRRIVEAGEAANEDDAGAKASKILVKQAKTKGVPQMTPYQNKSLEDREENQKIESAADTLVKEAQRRFGNDIGKQRDWISQQNEDDRAIGRALKRLRPPAPERGRGRGVAALEGALGGLGAPGAKSKPNASAPSSASANPYRR